ncbi:LOW QUALITY PROTEIN: dual serine/threonine and tyrosine protein kinase-like [Babylonia areolata]|uniref:LOW QUALITY PROTEIN: dual serine/threonine and tyrosine protein kinase-like n=1 Tax=Babylonia areolata TaxID=304850 RepID=UPI003FD1A205
MTVNLPNEIRKFCSHSYRLRQVFEDTRQCFGDINITGNFDGTPIVTAELLKEEQAEIIQTVGHPLSLVVFGQTPYAKSRLINELLNKPVLPSLEQDAQEGSRWRLVRFRQKDSASFFNPANPSFLIPDDYDLCDSVEAEHLASDTLPLQELIVSESDARRLKDGPGQVACLEVILSHPLLRFGTQVVMAPSGPERATTEVVEQCVGSGPSVLLYAFASDNLGEKDVQDLDTISKVTNSQPIAFLRVPHPGSRTTDTDPPDGAPRSYSYSVQQGQLDSSCNPVSLAKSHNHSMGSSANSCRPHISTNSATDPHSQFPTTDLYQQLCVLGYLPSSEEEAMHRHRLSQDYFMMESILIERFHEFIPLFSQFSRRAFQRYLINAATVMNNAHTRSLNMFILSAFDMSRDIIITPRKLEFAKAKEEELYRSLMAVAVSKISDIKEIVTRTIHNLSEDIQEDAAKFDFTLHGIEVKQGRVSPQDVHACTEKLQDMVLSRINSHVANELLCSFRILRDSYTGTLTRCLESLEEQTDSSKDSKTTDALKQILNAAYQVEITVHSSSSFISSLLEKMKQMMRSMPWNSPPEVTPEWKRKVALDMLSSLSETKLARLMAGKIRERLQHSHAAFTAALGQLQAKHEGRLNSIEEQRLKLRKVHAPRLAKLALESTSLRDMVLFGMPSMGREIGRGQYGVVYSCDKWANYSPVAIKSVVPPDEKHWNDLSLEFFYTKNIPDHPRVVALRGSVLDYMYGGGMTPAVLLVMDRLQRDLHTAIMQNLDWCNRLQVSIDVVEGLRFLHSQGLVHRDVKLKNVLLDKDNRGKISDLGFCKPEAMMSGSIVGTPIHMAPELVTGVYDNSVDVYAFGILFWYVCAGHVQMPMAFRHCHNKDELWSDVKEGLRPEHLPVFTDECWLLMQSCWQGDQAQRPYLGDVEAVLCSMHRRVCSRQGDSNAPADHHSPSGTRGRRRSRRMSSTSSTSRADSSRQSQSLWEQAVDAVCL